LKQVTASVYLKVSPFHEHTYLWLKLFLNSFDRYYSILYYYFTHWYYWSMWFWLKNHILNQMLVWD